MTATRIPTMQSGGQKKEKDLLSAQIAIELAVSDEEVGAFWDIENYPTNRWPSFSLSELSCHETGLCYMDESTLTRLQALRNKLGRPVYLSSAYRSPRHTVEKIKSSLGVHSLGRAVDVGCAGTQAYEVVAAALATGWTGIGISQRGASRFVHLDDLQPDEGRFTRPSLWSY